MAETPIFGARLDLRDKVVSRFSLEAFRRVSGLACMLMEQMDIKTHCTVPQAEDTTSDKHMNIKRSKYEEVY